MSGGNKRGRQSSSDLESPGYQDKKRTNMSQDPKFLEADVSTSTIENDMKYIKESLINIRYEQSQLKSSLHQKIDSSFQEVSIKLDKVFKELNDRIDIEIGHLSSRIDNTETKVKNVERIAQNIKTELFDTDVTVVAFGVTQLNNEDIVHTANELIQLGVGLSEVPVVRAMRLGSRTNKPGLCKIELCSKEDKIKVLQNKQSLSRSEKFKGVYIHSAQTHAERLIDLNFKTILGELANGGEYRVTGNGRVIRKEGPQNFSKQRTQFSGSQRNKIRTAADVNHGTDTSGNGRSTTAGKGNYGVPVSTTGNGNYVRTSAVRSSGYKPPVVGINDYRSSSVGISGFRAPSEGRVSCRATAVETGVHRSADDQSTVSSRLLAPQPGCTAIPIATPMLVPRYQPNEDDPVFTPTPILQFEGNPEQLGPTSLNQSNPRPSTLSPPGSVHEI